MKSRIALWFITILAGGAALLLTQSSGSGRAARRGTSLPGTAAPTAAPADTASFALLELFTSEGCSSCPPADDILGRIAADARGGRSRVIALAFHVDYWNRLGWADPFSDHAYAERQYAYATAFKLDGVYTPQLVVNGRSEFVGSNEARVRREIDDALARHAPVHVDVTAVPDAGAASIAVAYSLSGTVPDGAMVNLALVERGLATSVPRGENAGRTLHHENVVRAFRTITASAGGNAMLAVPAGVDLKNAAVVAYVQNRNTMEITGAAMVDLRQ